MSKPDPNLKLVVAFETPDPILRELAKTMLEDAGIEYSVVEEALTGFGFSPILNPVCRILVAEPQKQQALDVLKGLSESVADEDSGELS